MDWKSQYDKWLNFQELHTELKSELLSLDEKEKEDAFYKNLEFGTGGMRGELGVGTNRMNLYTVRKASAGLAKWIERNGEDAKGRGVVIAYDSRHQSKEFAFEAAKTLASRAIQSYVFDSLRPTPELSFAVRYLHAYAGIVITASHNPPQYNGYKVYGPDGGQLTLKDAAQLITYVNEIDDELRINVQPEKELVEAGRIKIIGGEVDEVYLQPLSRISEHDLGTRSDIKIVYTPLHGAGNQPVRSALQALGYRNIFVVEEQENPDPEFPTVTTPNPEEPAAFALAIQKGKEVDADLLIATDPDADRLGIAVKNNQGDYEVLTGNQIGALFLHYLLSEKQRKKTLPQNGVMLKTIVTSELGQEIATSFGVSTVNVLTGFKFIAEKIKEYEVSREYKFLFGYEESYGYLIGDFTRDKDAVQASIFAAEICAFYKDKGMSLYEAVLNLFEQYGYYQEGLRSLTLKGKEGAEQISDLLTTLREEPLREIANLAVITEEDYLTGIHNWKGKKETINLPRSNVLKYFLEDGSWVCVRPSGTEPKIKFYFGVKGDSLEESQAKLKLLSENFMAMMNNKLV